MVAAEFNRIDRQISNYRADSRIEQFNRLATTTAEYVGEEIVSLVKIARQVSELSHGCYDPTIKPLFDLWGFKTDSFHQPKAEELSAALETTGITKIKLIDASTLEKQSSQVNLDMSSIGQGYSVARIALLLEQQGIDNYMVEIGGELQTRGSKPDHSVWRIAIERPLPGQQMVQKILSIERTQPTSIMTSGTYHHYFDNQGKRFSHILDARTGKPVEHNTVSVTVIADDPSWADAWSTALLCLGAQQGSEIASQQGLRVLFIEQQGEDFVETPSSTWSAMTDIRVE